MISLHFTAAQAAFIEEFCLQKSYWKSRTAQGGCHFFLSFFEICLFSIVPLLMVVNVIIVIQYAVLLVLCYREKIFTSIRSLSLWTYDSITTINVVLSRTQPFREYLMWMKRIKIKEKARTIEQREQRETEKKAENGLGWLEVGEQH